MAAYPVSPGAGRPAGSSGRSAHGRGYGIASCGLGTEARMKTNIARPHYDTFESRIILRADDFWGGDDYGLFKHQDCLHSFTTAFGLPQVRHVCFCRDAIGAEFNVSEVNDTPQVRSRYVLKLTAAWRDWKKYEHPVTIRINGRPLFDDFLFLENVCKGWPSLYFDVPNELLVVGANRLEIHNGSKGENELLLERVEIQRHPDIHDLTIWHCPEFVNAGKRFAIGLHFLQPHRGITVDGADGLEYLGRSDNEFYFKATRPGEPARVSFRDGPTLAEASIGEVFPEKRAAVLVGFDGDDVRHDDSGEMDRCLRYMVHTGMGNFVSFRCGPGRNCRPQHPPSADTWKRWFEFCQANDVAYQLNHSPLVVALEPALYAGGHCAGLALHEPYLIFQPLNRHTAPDYVQAAADLEARRNAYVRYLSERAAGCRQGPQTRVYYGDPSLLCVYMRDAAADGILCEPVSNSSLLYGAARGTGKQFGAHIAADWYIGYPHDENAVKRFRLLLYLNYAYGGRRIYVESSAFKTNAFGRNDREDIFCQMVREELRKFYRFTCADERPARPEVPLAFIYGNNESLFWRHDDRIAEMVDTGNWDTLAWGKYEETSCRRLWRITDAWLPGLEFDDTGKDESLTRMFTGSPYGSVDVVLPDGDLSQYRAVAFTGWNTMTAVIYRHLLAYVQNGGVLFICGAHFDTRVDPEARINLFNDGQWRDLIGADIAGPGPAAYGKFRTGRLQPAGCQQRGEFLYEYQCGKGKVLYYNFIDFPHDPRLRRDMEAILRQIGRQVAQTNPFQIQGDDARYINCNLWGDKLYVSNINWRRESTIGLSVRGKDNPISIRLEPAQSKVFNLAGLEC